MLGEAPNTIVPTSLRQMATNYETNFLTVKYNPRSSPYHVHKTMVEMVDKGILFDVWCEEYGKTQHFHIHAIVRKPKKLRNQGAFFSKDGIQATFEPLRSKEAAERYFQKECYGKRLLNHGDIYDYLLDCKFTEEGTHEQAYHPPVGPQLLDQEFEDALAAIS